MDAGMTDARGIYYADLLRSFAQNTVRHDSVGGLFVYEDSIDLTERIRNTIFVGDDGAQAAFIAGVMYAAGLIRGWAELSSDSA